MTKRDEQALAETALQVAQDAATLVMQGYRQSIRVREKQPQDLVSEYDEKSEIRIRELLTERTADFAIVGEEQGGDETTDRPTWYIDPIDGTVNYVHGHPYFAVSIGLLVAGVPIAGAVVAPALGIAWHAWFDGTSGAAFRNGEACRVSDTARLSDALVTTGFPSNPGSVVENNLDTFVRVMPLVRGVRRCASAAIDICMVGDATYDACWERTLKTWDSAAAACVALAAGGKLTSLDGGVADLRTGRFLVSNGKIHAALLDVVRS